MSCISTSSGISDSRHCTGNFKHFITNTRLAHQPHGTKHYYKDNIKHCSKNDDFSMINVSIGVECNQCDMTLDEN